MRTKYIVARHKETGEVFTTLPVAAHRDVSSVFNWMRERTKPAYTLTLEDAPR